MWMGLLLKAEGLPEKSLRFSDEEGILPPDASSVSCNISSSLGLPPADLPCKTHTCQFPLPPPHNPPKFLNFFLSPSLILLILFLWKTITNTPSSL